MKNIPQFQRALLDWYRQNARKLPWRKTQDPYSIWVSEIMLQQTQVQTVIPYYERWLKKFPTLEKLAKAPVSEVLKSWAGLGYYRRARMLHQGAKLVSQKYSGKIPETVEELLQIPGIGRYTAGAIASIAFDQKVPVLDGNVIRVLTRLHAVEDDISQPKTIQKLWKRAEELIHSLSFPRKRESVGDFNQALMELGATICLPQNPSCLLCPVGKLCEARGKNPEKYPVNHKKEIAESLTTAALILRKNGKCLVQQQPLEGRWGGLWMFPHWKDKKSMTRETGLREEALRRRMTVQHGFTKYRIKLEVYECQEKQIASPPPRSSPLGSGARNDSIRGSLRRPVPVGPGPGGTGPKWVRLADLPKLAFPSPHRKIAEDLCKNG